MLSIGFGSGTNRPAFTRPPEAQLRVAEVDGEPMISATNGNLSVTIGSGPYAGTYTQRATDSAPLTLAMVEAVAVPILLPAISGTATEGDTLTMIPGLWVYSGADPGEQTVSWINNTDGATGSTGLAYTLQALDVGDTIKVSETFGGVTADSVVTPPIDASGPVTVPFAVTQLLQARAKTSPGLPSQFGTVDLSAYYAGTQILIFQRDITASAASIDGVVATHLTSGVTYGGNIFAHAFLATLTSQGTAAAPITITQPFDWNSQAVSVYAIEGGVVDQVAANGAGGGSANLTVTPTSTNNVMLALHSVNSGTVTTDWSANITETFEAVSGNRMMSLARADDVPAAAFNVTTTLSTGRGWGAVLVSISEASP